ncbi:MAG TPA: CocE/NonD family hydrolase [Thermoleophilaceae bacterium]|nr:CocE/NonD family hydrolase [Thermoleophilaceae bacterium]
MTILRRLALLALVLALAATPAAAAPVETGSISKATPTFEWEGGPLSGASLVGEPCGTSHQCEDILLHIADGGELEINWTATAPGGQGWLSFTLYESDAEGNPQGDPIVDTGAFDNEGALLTVVKPGDYVVRVGALLSTAATYEATAKLTAGDPDESAEYGPKPPDASGYDWYEKAGAEWLQAYIDEPDGTRLHADILRPKNASAKKKTPVILSIGPYFNHTGQTGPAGPTQGTDYDPFATPGPSPRFADFILGADVVRKGYTFVQVDLRGFGGSTGCLDWSGPGEQADVVAAVEWAASQPWSTGKVGMYGKSYDGVTGLLGEILQPKGLAAVVAQEPVYDMYRYLYAEGIRYHNSLATPALYDAIAATPGSVADEPEYFIGSVDSTGRPGCEALNWADQQDPNHQSPYWLARDLIAKAKDGRTPLFLTQGFLENNTKPDGTWDFFNAVKAPKRAWFGMWDHVRGTDQNEEGRLLMGRKGFNGEVLRFYDRWLKGIKPKVKDPTLVIQTNDGTWRGEEKWPPADAKALKVPLTDGEYVDDVGNKGTSDGIAASSATGVGVWTISKPLPHGVHIAGVPRLKLDVTTSVPNANLAGAVYDIDRDGKATLIHRQARMIPESGTYTIDLYGNDWKLPRGHRIGVLVSTAHAEWWLAAVPTMQTVSVTNGTLALPFLTYARDALIDGKRSVRLENYLANAPFQMSDETIEAGTAASFPLPPKLMPQATDPLTARLVKRGGGKRLVVRGLAPKGTGLKVRLLRRGQAFKAKRVNTGARRRYVARFKVRKAGRYRAVVTTRKAAPKLTARSNRVRVL